jgi:hypothetical protein
MEERYFAFERLCSPHERSSLALEVIDQISDCTSKDFAFQSDSVQAFSGILNSCCIDRNAHSHRFGVPIIYLARGRLKPDDKGILRVMTSSSLAYSLYLRITDSSDYMRDKDIAGFVAGLAWSHYSPAKRVPRFPRWLGAGWKGKVRKLADCEYRAATRPVNDYAWHYECSIRASCDIKHEMTDGSLMELLYPYIRPSYPGSESRSGFSPWDPSSWSPLDPPRSEILYIVAPTFTVGIECTKADGVFCLNLLKGHRFSCISRGISKTNQSVPTCFLSLAQHPSWKDRQICLLGAR